jgi:oligopeptide transport system substrate-binding protein
MTARHCRAVLTVLLALTAGCTRQKEDSLDLKVHIPKVNLQLDPHRMEDAYSMMIVGQLYRGLLRFNSDGDVVPDLAASWKESTDKKSYVFKLRDATFSNGEKITAQNVQMSFARIFLLSAGMAADLDYIKGAKEFIASKNLSDLGVRVLSDTEVGFELAHPSALFLKHVAVIDCGIMPFHTLAESAGAPKAFSGPYKIASESPTEVDVVKWRSDALESKHPPRRISFFGTSELGVALAASGKTDSLDREPLTLNQRKELEAKGWGASPTELTGESFIVLNPSFIPDELRRYLYSKVDPEKATAIFNEPQYKAAYGVIPTGFPGVLSKAELASVKDENPTYHGKRVSFELDYDPSADFDARIVEYLKTVWPSDLIDVRFNPLSKAKKLKRLFAKTSQAVIGRKAVDYPDGYSVLTYFKGKYESNYFHVDDPAIDASINESLKEFDVKKRAELYKKIQVQILRKYTTIPILFGAQASGFWSNKIKTVPSHPMGYHTMPFETIEMRAE